MKVVKNALIMAAGTSSRFAPLSYEKPKALLKVKGEILIERQIRQLKERKINEIYVVTGYRKEDFMYLKDKFNVTLIHNKYFNKRNNNSSIKIAEKILSDTYICSADNYFTINPFTKENEGAYYASIYEKNDTDEWCITVDKDDYIRKVTIGGKNSYIMMGHSFWDSNFSKKFIEILNKDYEKEETKDKLWESIYIEHIDELPMKIKRYKKEDIFEFDSLDELREFDIEYKNNTHSKILKDISNKLQVEEAQIKNIKSIKKDSNEAIGFTFFCKDKIYKYEYKEKNIIKIK